MTYFESIIQEVDVESVLAILMVFSLGFLGLTGGLLIGLVKAWRGGTKPRSTELDTEETKAFQELQRGFQRMEERVEALDTLILDRSREKRAAANIEN